MYCMFCFNKKKQIRVSVCVPVCGTEGVLTRCLESLAAQNFEGLEIVVVDDSGRASKAAGGLSAKKVVRDFKKELKNHPAKYRPFVKFIAHEENKALVEARRSALYEASGKYLMFVDSDDCLLPGAVETLYVAADRKGARIVQGRAEIFCREENKNTDRFLEIYKKINNVFLGGAEDCVQNKEGSLTGKEILEGFLIKRNHNGFLWGKIFERELCLEAFDKIPPVYCVFGEDFLTYFFIALCAAKSSSKYAGIEQKVYLYSTGTGISSDKKIKTLEEWKKVCSAASACTVLLDYLENLNNNGENSWVTEDMAEEIKAVCRYYAKNNLQQLNGSVVPELRDEAYRELCRWWGEGMVKTMEATLRQNS